MKIIFGSLFHIRVWLYFKQEFDVCSFFFGSFTKNIITFRIGSGQIFKWLIRNKKKPAQPATFMYLSRARAWISNCIYAHAAFFTFNGLRWEVIYCFVRGGVAFVLDPFCWYLRNCWQSLSKHYFHKNLYKWLWYNTN